MKREMTKMAINKTMKLSLELASILALSYQPLDNTSIRLIPRVNPPERPIKKGLVLVRSCSRFFDQ